MKMARTRLFIGIIAVLTGVSLGAFSAAASPDLIISGIVRSPATPAEGAWVSFDAYVQNIGSDTTAENITRFRLDHGGDGSWDTTITQPTRAVGAGATEVVSFRLTVGGPGFYRSEFCADSGGTVFESNEFNNCLTENFEVRATEQPRPQPTVDLKVNSSDGPVTVPFNSTVTLSWTSASAASCFASGGWSGSKSLQGSESAGPLTSGQIFTLTCDGVSDSVTVNVTSQPPATVDLKINGSDGTITVAAGASAILSWTSSNADSCFASGNWSGARPTSGSENTGPIPSFQSFTITCGSASDSVSANVTTQPTNAPTVSLTANPSSVSRGNGSTLSWTSSNADSCFAFGGWSGARAFSGSQFVIPSQTTTYFLSCSNQAGSNSASATINVTDVFPTVNLTASPTSIRRGESAVLNWSSSNADNCFAFGGWSGARALSGSEVVVPSFTTAYTITCSNQAGSDSRSVTVSVGEIAPSVSLSASPISIIPGQTSILTWSSSNANSCFVSGGWSGFRPRFGSEAVAPGSTTTYFLTCLNDSTSRTASVTVFVATTLNRPTVNFNITPSSIVRGGSAVLVWHSFDAFNCFASGGWSGSRSTSGSEVVNPSQTTTYALSCSNGDGSTSASRTLTVFEPTPASPARFTAACVSSPARAAIGQNVIFAGGETGGTQPATFNWSGALSGTGLTRTVSFSTTGTKTALLTVIDSRGQTATASCSVDIVAPAPAAPAAPTTPTTPTTPQSPVTLTFRNVPAPETAEEEQPFLATIFGQGLGRILGIIFLILFNAALIFLLVWLYKRTKKKEEEERREPPSVDLPQEFLEPEIS